MKSSFLALLICDKTGSDCCKLPVKITKEEEATAGLVLAATGVAVLSELGGIFTVKQEQRPS